MAARKTSGTEPNTAKDAETLDRFVRVLRTSGFKAAGACEEEGQVGLIATDCKEGRANRKGSWKKAARHEFFSNFSSSAARTGNGALATLGLG